MSQDTFEYPPFVPPQPVTYPPFNPSKEEWERGKQIAALLLRGLNPSDVLR